MIGWRRWRMVWRRWWRRALLLRGDHARLVAIRGCLLGIRIEADAARLELVAEPVACGDVLLGAARVEDGVGLLELRERELLVVGVDRELAPRDASADVLAAAGFVEVAGGFFQRLLGRGLADRHELAGAKAGVGV